MFATGSVGVGVGVVVEVVVVEAVVSSGILIIASSRSSRKLLFQTFHLIY